MNTALLLIDIQNDYFNAGKMPLVEADVAAANARVMLEKFRADTLTIVHIQHIAISPTATFFLPGTHGAEIHDSVKPQNQEVIITKHYPNSFRETKLLDFLKSKEVGRLVICGMMTHMCVDATVRAAKDFGFEVVLIGDACATRDLDIGGQTVLAQNVQSSFLAAMSYFYATTQTTQQYLIKHSK